MGQNNEKQKEEKEEIKKVEEEKKINEINEEDIRLYSLKSNAENEEESENKSNEGNENKGEQEDNKEKIYNDEKEKEEEKEDNNKKEDIEQKEDTDENEDNNKKGDIEQKEEIDKKEDIDEKEDNNKNEDIDENVNTKKEEYLEKEDEKIKGDKEQIKEEDKENNSKEINNEENNNQNNDIKSIIEDNKTKKLILPQIDKFNMTKSSSTVKFDNINNIKLSYSKLKIGEIRINDIFENRKINENNIKPLKLKSIKSCYYCGTSNFEDFSPIIFSCNHIVCFKCIIKNLLFLQFKNIENKNIIQFNCSCMKGSCPILEMSEFLQKIREMNTIKEEKNICEQHKNKGIKFCKDCQMWLCEECIKIHSLFNKNHCLLEYEVQKVNKCKVHKNYFTEYFCMKCNREICPLCIIPNGAHDGHKKIMIDKFKIFAEEIKSNLKFKTYDEFLNNLENIKEKIIKYIQENYIKEINEKIDNLNQIIDIIKESYNYFYSMLEKEKQDYQNLDFLKQIGEFLGIETEYNNLSDIIRITKQLENFDLYKDIFSYKFQINESYYQLSFDLNHLLKKKHNIYKSGSASLIIHSKNTLRSLKFNEIKYEKSIKINKGTIYSIIKINKDEIAAACGNEIIIINDFKEDINEEDKFFNSYPYLKGHTKNILCLALLSGNILASGSDDKTIKIWDILNRKCIKTLSNNYKRIDSLLAYKDNILIAGTYNIIRILNVDTKEEILNLIGHEKTICSIIKINENLIASSSYDNLIKIWNIKNQICEFNLFGHDNPVYCILLLKDGRLASGSGNKSIKIWNLSKRNCEFTLIGHKREVRDIKQLSKNYIMSASVDKTIKIWNLSKKNCVQTLVSHYDVIYTLCIFDKHKFVSGGRDQDIICWKS